MSRYTDIGDVIITSTASGEIKVRVVHRRGMRSVLLSLLVIALAGLAIAAWLERTKQKQPAVENTAAAEIAQPTADKPGIAPHAMTPEQKAAAQPSENPQASSPGPQEQAKDDFRKAQQLAQQGRVNEAIERYRASLLVDAGNDSARQALVDLLVKDKRNADAERELQLGLKNNPRQSGYALQLARLLDERKEASLALDVMQKTLPQAAGQADYQAFYASLLQRQKRHSDAVTYYQKALVLKPGSGEWLMGLGVSLQASGRADEAQEAFKRALETHNLSRQSRSFVEKQIPPAPAAAAAVPVLTPPPAAPQ